MLSGRRSAELADLIAERGAPKMVVSDNGIEPTSNAVPAWSGAVGVEWQRAGLNLPVASPALLRDKTGLYLVATCRWP